VQRFSFEVHLTLDGAIFKLGLGSQILEGGDRLTDRLLPGLRAGTEDVL
jgi:hypothetical protein